MTEKPTMTLLEDGRLHIHIPMIIRRHSGRKMVIAPEALDGAVQDAPRVQKEPLVEALKNAHEWNQMLESGEFKSVAALARHLDLSRQYVNRIISLVNLAPDIQEAILVGTEPENLSLAKLINGFPENWSEQKKLFN